LPAWLPLPFRWQFIAFYRGISFSRACKNSQGLGSIGTAASLSEIIFGAQGRNLFCYRDINELVKSYALRFRSLAQLVE